MDNKKTTPPARHNRHTGLLLFVFVILAFGGGVWLGRGPFAQPPHAAPAKQLYTCGMDPQVIQDHPGNCPICGMVLTPMRKRGTSAADPADPSDRTDPSDHAERLVYIDPVTTQNMGLRTDVVTQGPLRRTIRTVATVEYDETSLAEVTTKFRGWIEKLHVSATGQQVHRGDPLFEIYSPELYSAQTEYLMASADSTGAFAGMKASATTKLKYYDISDDQIATLEKTRRTTKTLRVDAPRDGIVVERSAVEGQMVEAGMRLYRIADLGLVWVVAQVFEQDVPFVRVGQEAQVSLSYLPDRKFRGRVTFIYPTVDEKTRTVRIRMEFHNPGYYLKPGMFATVELTTELAALALLVPDTAVLRSGDRNTVFVALGGGKFEPRAITLGPRSADNQYQVLSGLSEGERIVTSGQFLLDSESQLRDAIAKMSSVVPPSNQPPTTNAAAQTVSKSNAFTAAFVCPMPEHVAIVYQHPGNCPLCRMALVPVNAEQLAQLRPGEAIDHYTCPMPEHADVNEAKAGKCPKCGMTLIPVMKSPAPPPATPPATPAAATQTPKLYTCPMSEDVDVVSDHPEKCRKCGMTLVPTETVAHGKKAAENWRQQHIAK
ncbi:MAG: efflux RND transporter periplasmic adaptor subunit [bacterium]